MCSSNSHFSIFSFTIMLHILILFSFQTLYMQHVAKITSNRASFSHFHKYVENSIMLVNGVKFQIQYLKLYFKTFFINEIYMENIIFFVMRKWSVFLYLCFSCNRKWTFAHDTIINGRKSSTSHCINYETSYILISLWYGNWMKW